MKGRTKQEHYIPNKSYLDYFVDDSINPNSLWVYFDKKQIFNDSSKAEPKNITPINLCKEAYLYETPKLPLNSIEKMLQMIEDNYKHVLDNKILKKKKLTTEDRIAISQFISTLEVRTPLNKEHSEDFINEVKDHVVHLEEANMGGRKSSLHKQLDDAEKNNLMFLQTLTVALEVNRYQVADMLFLSPQFEDKNTYFITSDFPVSLLDFSLMNNFYQPTPLDATVEVTIPLTPKVTLLINHLNLNGYRTIDHNYIQEINNRTLQRSNKFIISPRKLDKDFTYYTVKRYPQSFVVLYMSDRIRKERAKRTDFHMKKTAKKFIKSTANNIMKLNQNVYSLDNILIKPKNIDDYKWFVRAFKLFASVLEETEVSALFKLKKPIKTSKGLLKSVKVYMPSKKYMLKLQIESIILAACRSLYKKDYLLIKSKTNERTIAAQLAFYLKPYFKGFDVDPKYNREGDSGDPKRSMSEELLIPDIIVHKRGDIKEHNLLAIQVKGYWNKEDRSKDSKDLRKLKEKYNYHFLYRIELKLKTFELIQEIC